MEENRKETAVQDKEPQRLEDEALDKVAGGLGPVDIDRDHDDYYYQGAPDD